MYYSFPFLKSWLGHFLYKFSNPPFHIERQMAPLLAISLLSEIVVTQSVSHNPFTANFEQRDPKREFRPSSRLVAHTVSIFGQQCSLLHRTYWIDNKLDDQINAVQSKWSKINIVLKHMLVLVIISMSFPEIYISL